MLRAVFWRLKAGAWTKRVQLGRGTISGWMRAEPGGSDSEAASGAAQSGGGRQQWVAGGDGGREEGEREGGMRAGKA